MLDQVKKAYEEAESAIKQYERLTLAQPYAAVNQLRYAGFHLLKAQDEKDASLSSAHLDKALGHCRRAMFDAVEGVVYSYLDFIAAFQNLCRSRKGVLRVYPDYVKDFNRVAEISDALQSIGKVQQLTDEQHRQIVALATELRAMKFKTLRHMVEVERLEKVTADEESIAAIRQLLIPFVATVLGTVVGVVGLFMAVFPTLQQRYSTGLATIVSLVLFVLLALGTKWFYGWSTSHMLSPDQRDLLKSHGFKLT